MSKRNVKAVPQVESTISIEHTTAPLIKCTAKVAFTLGNAKVEVGETFFLVKSVRRAGRYYVVHFSSERRAWQCSCGANCTKHEHTKAAQQHVVDHVVKPRIEAIMATTQPVVVEEPVASEFIGEDGLDNRLVSSWIARNKRADVDHVEFLKGFNEQLQDCKVAGSVRGYMPQDSEVA
jgi:hypothetical protein